MRKVTSTEVQNNFGKYLMMAQEEEIIITRNGQEIAKLGKVRPDFLAEEALHLSYGSKKTYEELLEISRNSPERFELIDGEIVLLTSPKTTHQLVVAELFALLHSFFTEGTCLAIAAPYDITIRRSPDDINVVQPDLMVICDLADHLDSEGYYQGVPTLICEVLSESTRRIDLIKKMELYMTGGVKEYWVVDPENESILVYGFEDGDISRHMTYKAPDQARSIVFPDLGVDLFSLFRKVKISLGKNQG